MWNGNFSPSLAKHRDYRHKTFVQHEKDNGGRLTVGRSVPVSVSPITQEALDEVSEYYEVTFTLHTGDEYVFLIYSDTAGPPSEEEIEDQIEQQLKRRVPGGRRLEDYIADVEVEGVDRPTGGPVFSLSDIIGGTDGAVGTRTRGKFSVDDLI